MRNKILLSVLQLSISGVVCAADVMVRCEYNGIKFNVESSHPRDVECDELFQKNMDQIASPLYSKELTIIHLNDDMSVKEIEDFPLTKDNLNAVPGGPLPLTVDGEGNFQPLIETTDRVGRVTGYKNSEGRVVVPSWSKSQGSGSSSTQVASKVEIKNSVVQRAGDAGIIVVAPGKVEINNTEVSTPANSTSRVSVKAKDELSLSGGDTGALLNTLRDLSGVRGKMSGLDREKGFDSAAVKSYVDGFSKKDQEARSAVQELSAKLDASQKNHDVMSDSLGKMKGYLNDSSSGLFKDDRKRAEAFEKLTSSLDVQIKSLGDACAGVPVGSKNDCLKDVDDAKKSIIGLKGKCLSGDGSFVGGLGGGCGDAIEASKKVLANIEGDVKKIDEVIKTQSEDLRNKRDDARKAAELLANSGSLQGRGDLQRLREALKSYADGTNDKQLDLKLLSMTAGQLKKELNLSEKEADQLVVEIAKAQKGSIENTAIGSYINNKIGGALMSCELYNAQAKACDPNGASKVGDMGQRSIYNDYAGANEKDFKDAVVKALDAKPVAVEQ